MNPSRHSAPVTAKAAEDSAAVWFWKKDSDNWTEQDQAEFDAWLNRSTAHRIAYLRLQAGWKGAARMKALGAGVARGELPPPGHWGNDLFLGGRNLGRQKPASVSPQSRECSVPVALESRTFGTFRWALTATVILALGVTFSVQLARTLSANQYSTPVGGLDTVSLADGSRITLNTDTRIRVDLDEKERRIHLNRGEAFFDVAKDSTRPFIVYVDDKRVTAVGTRFSVRRDADDIQIVVTEGRVKLEQPSAIPQLRKLAGAHDRPVTMLPAGAVARTEKSEVLVVEASALDAEQLLSWRSGYLVFEATPLAEAVAEFNRYNQRKIVIDDPSLAAVRIGGNFRSNNTEAFLWLLKSGFQVEIVEYDDRVHLSAR